MPIERCKFKYLFLQAKSFLKKFSSLVGKAAAKRAASPTKVIIIT